MVLTFLTELIGHACMHLSINFCIAVLRICEIIFKRAPFSLFVYARLCRKLVAFRNLFKKVHSLCDLPLQPLSRLCMSIF